MSLDNLIGDFYAALFEFKNTEWAGKAVHAADALGIDDNIYSQADNNLKVFRRYPTPRRKTLVSRST